MEAGGAGVVGVAIVVHRRQQRRIEGGEGLVGSVVVGWFLQKDDKRRKLERDRRRKMVKGSDASRRCSPEHGFF